MDRFERLNQVEDEVFRFIERLRREYKLTYGESIGILFMKTLDIWHESAHEEN